MRLLGSLAVALMLQGCGDFPRDSKDTLKLARAGEPLKIGYTTAEPWVREAGAGAEPQGIEPELVRQWARAEGVRISWIRGSEAQLVEGLAQNSLDIAVGGLTSKSPHGKRVGTTQPYLSARIVVGAVGGAPAPESWKGVPIAYDARRPQFAGSIEKLRAIAVEGKPGPATRYAAVYEMELGGLGLTATGKTLLTEKRVMATAPAENALVLSLDKFLHGRKAEIEQRLAAQARQ